MDSKKEMLNVLLLGETGVGKSTFINALLNYSTYPSLEEAIKHKLLYLIPSKFTLLDNELKETVIAFGTSSNETQTSGVSSTQQPRSYLFELKDTNKILRIIDTPGIGDTRGMEYDERNTEDLLTFVGELEYLHCICVLLKPNNSRLSVLFNYCIKHILFRLNKEVRPNIVFLFTNARSSFYTPGDTLQPLRVILDEIQKDEVENKIPLDSSNIFCVDNESFRYLAAKIKGIPVPEDDFRMYKSSWNKSANVCKRLANYVLTLPPVPMQGIVSVNESRRIVGRLAKPVVELMILQEKTLVVLAKHEKKLNQVKYDIDDLRKMLYIPTIKYIVGKKSIYTETKQTFNAGVSLSILPPFVTVKLGYKYSKDQRTEDHVVAIETLVEDPRISASLKDETSAKEVVKKQVEAMRELAKEYKQEARVILAAAAVFTKFLKENAIIFGSDPLEAYLNNALEEEKAANEDPDLVETLNSLLVRYQVKRDYTYAVSPNEVRKHMEKLLNLKHSGDSFKFFYKKKFIFDDKRLPLENGNEG